MEHRCAGEFQFLDSVAQSPLEALGRTARHPLLVCEALGGHFAGAHLMGGQYNVGGLDFDFKFLGTNLSSLKDSRYEGWFVGAGVSYGYSWILNKHWNIEAELGIGWTYNRYDVYPCTVCGRKIRSKRRPQLRWPH